jgi:hypothetical protein
MKKLAVMFALLGVVAGVASAADVSSVGPGQGVVVPSTDTNPCPGSILWNNIDGSFENGYAWSFGGAVAPNYGAWAEGYNGIGTVCGVQLALTTVAGTSATVDAYVWASDGTNPTSVLSLTPALPVTGIGLWPNVTTHDINVVDAAVSGDYFVGFWGIWPGAQNLFYIASDEDGFGGSPRTNIAPGIGYPTGWNSPTVIPNFAGCQALGIGAYLLEGPVPVQETSWGAIKNLYN